MELYAKGQLSFLILTCLQERDFYGLDIISEITNRSNGRINLKKPSVYSNLTRMEKLGYISAYLQSSDFGPNRKYYSLTEKGRGFYKELKEYFDRNNIDVFKDFEESDSPIAEKTLSNPIVEETVTEEKSVSNEEFFDFSSINEENNEENEQNENSEELQVDDIDASPATTKLEIEENLYISENLSNSPIIQEEKPGEDNRFEQESQDEASIEEYNKRLYDISKDINKFKRKRSFAEDQIAMTAAAPLTDSQEKSKANIEEFKNSIIENKTKYQNDQRISNLDFSRYTNPNRTLIHEEPKKEEIKNDSVFITERYDIKDLARPKRIEPPRLKINTVDTKESILPAPKRDLTIDPSHKEILTKLYAKTKDGSVAEVREDSLYDFEDLKQYYKSQNISFTPYRKSADKAEHNTNKLYLMVSLVSLFACAGLSALLYLILSSFGLVNTYTNFFFMLPALLIVDVVWKLSNYIRFKAWLPSQMLPQWQIWSIFFIVVGGIISCNFIFGLSAENFALFATTILLPILLAAILIPARYYFKRFLLIKYWK